MYFDLSNICGSQKNLSFFKHLAFRSAIQIAWHNRAKFFSKWKSFFRGVARGAPRNTASPPGFKKLSTPLN